MTCVFWLKAIKVIIYLARLYTCTWPCYDKEQRKEKKKTMYTLFVNGLDTVVVWQKKTPTLSH